MTLHDYLYNQLMKIKVEHENAKELEVLYITSAEVSKELKIKVTATYEKELLGQDVTEDEQSEINSLIKKQGELYIKIADKLLEK